MADLNLNVTLSARNRGIKEVRAFRDAFRDIEKVSKRIGSNSASVAGKWKEVSRVSQQTKRTLSEQTREVGRQRRGIRQITIEEAKRNELARRHNQLMRDRARASLGGARKRGPGFDPDAPSSNLSAAASAADRFSAAGERGLRSIATAGLEFGTAVREVQTLTDNISGDQIAAITTGAAKEFGALPTEQVRAFYQIVSAGTTDAAGAQKLLAEANKIAIAGVTDVEGGFDALNAIMKPYGMNAADAADASDQLFAAVRLGKTTLPALAANLSKITPLAAEAGVSSAEVLAAVATITAETGSNTEMASTQIAAMMASLIKSTPKAEAEMARLGLRSAETGQQFKTAREAVEELGTEGFLALVKGSAEFNDKTMGNLFSNVRSLRGSLALGGAAAEKFGTNIAEIENSGGAAAKALEKFGDDPALKLRRMNAEWEDMKIQLSKDLLPAVVEMAKAVRPMIKDLASFASKNPWIAKIALASVAGGKVLAPGLHMMSGLAGMTGGRGFGMFAGQRAADGAAPSAFFGGGKSGFKNKASGAIGGAAGSALPVLAALGIGYEIGTIFDEATGASDMLAKAMGRLTGQAEALSKTEMMSSADEVTRRAGLGSDLARARDRLANLKEQGGSLAANTSGVGLGMMGAGLTADVMAKKRAIAAAQLEVRRLETGKTQEERLADQKAMGGPAAAIAALGIELNLKVDQDGRVKGATVTKAKGAEVDLSTNVGRT